MTYLFRILGANAEVLNKGSLSSWISQIDLRSMFTATEPNSKSGSVRRAHDKLGDWDSWNQYPNGISLRVRDAFAETNQTVASLPAAAADVTEIFTRPTGQEVAVGLPLKREYLRPLQPDDLSPGPAFARNSSNSHRVSLFLAIDGVSNLRDVSPHKAMETGGFVDHREPTRSPPITTVRRKLLVLSPKEHVLSNLLIHNIYAAERTTRARHTDVDRPVSGHSVSLILDAARRNKHGLLLGPDCDAPCGSNMLRLRSRPRGKNAPTLAHNWR